MYCEECGEKLTKQDKFCPGCGVEVGKTQEDQTNEEVPEEEETTTKKLIKNKKPTQNMKIIAIILNFILPGLGHLALGKGYRKKGILLIIGVIISVILMVAGIGFFTYIIIWLYGIISVAKMETSN